MRTATLPRFEEVTRIGNGWAFTVTFPDGTRRRYRTDKDRRGLYLMLAPALPSGYRHPPAASRVRWEPVAWWPTSYRWPATRDRLDATLEYVFRHLPEEDPPPGRGGRRAPLPR